MAILVNFDGKQILEPGSYTTIKAGFEPKAAIATYGDVVLIDTGSGKDFGFGGGINGEYSKDHDSVYVFGTAADAKKALKGGILYDIVDYLWLPQIGGQGPNSLTVIKAATTTAAKSSFAAGEVTTPETRATATVTCRDGITYQLNDHASFEFVYSGAVWIIQYQILTTITSGTELATAVAAYVNSITSTINGVSATSTGAVVTISAPTNAGASINGVGITLGSGSNYFTSSTVFTGGVNAIFASGLVVATYTEGTGANGVLKNGNLTRGYGWKVRRGVLNTNKFIFDFYEGQYRGVDDNGREYELEEQYVKNYIITSSVEVSTNVDLYKWMNSDSTFKAYFHLTTGIPTTETAYDNTFLSTRGTTINLFTGGTTAYNSADFDTVLTAIEDFQNSLFLSDNYGIVATPSTPEKLAGINQGALSTNNVKLLSHIKNSTIYTDKIMFVGGGKDKGEFANSLTIAATFDSENVVLPHSDIKVVDGTVGTRYLSTFYHAALICGLNAGVEPQVPITQKNVRVMGVKHVLSTQERIVALNGGVLHLKQAGIGNKWVVNLGCNTLQKNNVLYNTDGSTYEISIVRIKHQMNKELKINGGERFPGGNYNTVDKEDIKLFTEAFCQDRVATKEKDNLIILFKNVTVKFQGDGWYTTYCFVANGPINKLFTTGYLLDPNVELNNN